MTQTPRQLFVVGVSHHRAPMEIREKLSLGTADLRQLNQRILDSGRVESWVILNTCNRLEIYAFSPLCPDPWKLLELIAEAKDCPLPLLQQYAHSYTNAKMASHLFTVCAGIDSQMVGETEIFGQVKQAWKEAQVQGHISGPLNRIFEKAFQAAKWARQHTSIGFGQVTVGNVSVELAERIFGALRDCRLLIVGSGEVAERVLQSLVSRGCRDITIAARNIERATSLAKMNRAAVMEFSIFHEQLELFDIVIFSTASEEKLLDTKTTGELQRKRGYRPLFLIDLAMPRDVDPRVSENDDVFLFNLEDLSRIANENLEQRRRDIEMCRTEMGRRSWQAWLRFYRTTGWRGSGGPEEGQD